MYPYSQNDPFFSTPAGAAITPTVPTTAADESGLFAKMLAYVMAHPVATLVAAGGYLLWWTGKKPA